jgi:ankyrin repeat protein
MTDEGAPAAKRQKLPDCDCKLWNAVFDGDNAAVERLLASGADPNWRPDMEDEDVWGYGYCGESMLETAASHGHLRCAEMLVRAGAALEYENALGRTALDDVAWKADSYDAVHLLVRLGASTANCGDPAVVGMAIAQCMEEDAVAKTLCTGTHSRLGNQSPLQLLAGFGWITKFIALTSIGPPYTKKHEPELL